MVQRVVNPDLTASFHRQTMGPGEVGIADVVLRSRGVGRPEFGGPPVRRRIGHEQAVVARTPASRLGLRMHSALTLRLKRTAEWGRLVIRERVRNVVANVVDPRFQVRVEQVADHRHAAPHPLARATELGVRELGHGPVAVVNGDQHVRRRVERNAVTLRQLLNELLTGG